MLKFSKLNILNHGFYGLWDFTAVGGSAFEVWGACSWVLNQDLQDFEDYRGRLRIELEGYS